MNINPICIIAEAGINHNGSVETAIKMVDAAKAAGADIVKFQIAKVEKMTSRFAKQAEYQKKNTGENISQLEMLKKLHFGKDGHETVNNYAKQAGIEYMSSPFDMESVDELLSLNIKRIKVGSGEITNAPMLIKIASSGLPVILSTGMSTLEETELAIGALSFGYLNKTTTPSLSAFRECYKTCRDSGLLAEKVTLLHCTTEYPAPVNEVNLRAISTMKDTFGLPIGYSDHTEGITVSIAAAAIGAVVIEKHFTLDKNMPGPDHKASIEPAELKQLVSAIRQIEQALGNGEKVVSPSEQKNLSVARKSIVASGNIKKGEKFNENNITLKRPGTGISPMLFWELIGKTATRDYSEDQELEEKL